ncbi:DnaJ domain-containing protein [Kaarinaea lacus]
MRTLLIFIAIVIVLLILRSLARRSTLDLKKLGRQLLLILAGGLFLFLLATGRLHWLFAVGAAALPLLYRLLPLLRYVPLLRSLYRRYQTRQQRTSGASVGQTSTVQSAYLRMVLNHDTGDMDGEVLDGHFKGQWLHEFKLEQLLLLLSECQQDQDSQALLTAYLDRHHENWRDDVTDQEQYEAPSGAGKMSQQEAYEILGLDSRATEKDIVQAHRRLMQKVHPDHGGSTYLAAKINLAKDVLLNKS